MSEILKDNLIAFGDRFIGKWMDYRIFLQGKEMQGQTDRSGRGRNVRIGDSDKLILSDSWMKEDGVSALCQSGEYGSDRFC